jgi:predicted transcriptional regulator
MRIHELLFELSNPARLKILSILQEDTMKLSHVSKKLNMSTPETSRHLERLTNVRLVEKKADGLYRITPFGNLILLFIPAIDFLSGNIGYFNTHDLSPIPLELLRRIGELSEAEIKTGAMELFHDAEKSFSEAEEYIWILTNQILMSSLPILEKQVRKGVEFKVILPRNYRPPPESKSMKEMGIQVRVLDDVRIILALTEKDSGVLFPGVDGKIDYSTGISGSEPGVHGWIKDLFEYYWNKATPIRV